ncbi:amidohydrolase [Microvirga sp. BT689]|uniref:amidohydrolase family protein n=1 Tax=Microvirga arvi TaxID=2778731 RepID=UPI00194EF039|nr:amidohydrolase family protein [Microvirga arvi]MBM6581256.1 amidohydrolase [Microvirga arvi]
MNIDFHSHVIPTAFVAAIENDPARLKARIIGTGSDRKVVHDQGYAYPLFAEFTQPEAKLAAMDRKGIDISVLSPAPPTFTYWADRDLAVKVTSLVNDGVADFVAIRKDRFRGMGILPMQHPDDAIAELERIVEVHGFRSVEIGTGIEGVKLSDQRFRPVLKRASELGIFILAHPYYIGNKSGLEDYYLTNLIGNPLETTLMVADLMYSGTLDELPDLKIGLAHGGGFAPYQIGRLAHGHKVRSETRAKSQTSPLDLLRRFYFDSVVFEPKALTFLADLVGAEHVFLGTDAPFDMGDEDPVKTIADAPGLTDEQRAQIAGRTALSLLGEA